MWKIKYTRVGLNQKIEIRIGKQECKNSSVDRSSQSRASNATELIRNTNHWHVFRTRNFASPDIAALISHDIHFSIYNFFLLILSLVYHCMDTRLISFVFTSVFFFKLDLNGSIRPRLLSVHIILTTCVMDK